jgi:preprotein translocase subunit SecE
MTPKAEAQSSRFDLVKWLAVVALVVVGVVGNQYYSASPILYRVLRIARSCCCGRFHWSADSKG